MWRTIILDADSLLYRCGFAAKGEHVSHACQNLKSQIKKIKDALECDSMEIYIKGKGNFRDEVATSRVYKGTRTMEVPSSYHDLRKYIIEVHGAKEVDGMEADDACSLALYADSGMESRTILAAMDKDLWNTPGWHFNYDPRKWRTDYVTLFEANRNFLRQMVSGDTSDNVAGLPFVTDAIASKYKVRKGPAGPAAAKALTKGSNTDSTLAIMEAYIAFGEEIGWSEVSLKEYFLEQGQLLWMTRALDEERKPVRWSIPEDLWGTAVERNKGVP